MVRGIKLSCLLLLTNIFQGKISLETEPAVTHEIPSRPKTIDHILEVKGHQSKRWLHASHLMLATSPYIRINYN